MYRHTFAKHLLFTSYQRGEGTPKEKFVNVANVMISSFLMHGDRTIQEGL